MLKFWKKKPTETTSEQPSEQAATPPGDGHVANTVALDNASPVLDEARAELAPAEPAVVDEPPPPAGAPESTPTKRSWRERLAGSGFAKGLSSLFVRHPNLDDDLLDELETLLITADVGVEASTTLVDGLRKRMHKREFAAAAALLAA